MAAINSDYIRLIYKEAFRAFLLLPEESSYGPEDCIQQAVSIALTIEPKYKPSKNTKLSTFLVQCIRNYFQNLRMTTERMLISPLTEIKDRVDERAQSQIENLEFQWDVEKIKGRLPYNAQRVLDFYLEPPESLTSFILTQMYQDENQKAYAAYMSRDLPSRQMVAKCLGMTVRQVKTNISYIRKEFTEYYA